VSRSFISKKSIFLFRSNVDYVREAEIHTAEPLVPETSAFEFELAIEKLKSHKSPGIDQMPTELIKQGVGQFAV
jgi:hypothetical protein